jgi:hypothetical protein
LSTSPAAKPALRVPARSSVGSFVLPPLATLPVTGAALSVAPVMVPVCVGALVSTATV